MRVVEEEEGHQTEADNNLYRSQLGKESWEKSDFVDQKSTCMVIELCLLAGSEALTDVGVRAKCWYIRADIPHCGQREQDCGRHALAKRIRIS